MRQLSADELSADESDTVAYQTRDSRFGGIFLALREYQNLHFAYLYAKFDKVVAKMQKVAAKLAPPTGC